MNRGRKTNYSEGSDRPLTWEVQERRLDNGVLVEMILTDWVESEGLRGPAAISREMHVARKGRNDWEIRITGPRGGSAENIILPRAGFKAFLQRLLEEL